MDGFSVSIGAAVASLGVFLSVIKQRTDSARAMGALEQRVTSLEARTKSIDGTLGELRSEISRLSEVIIRLDARLTDTPLPLSRRGS